MRIETFTFNGFQENTYLIIDDQKNCVIVDPGCYELNEKKELIGFIENNNLKPLAILNTHAHIDHVLGVSYISNHFKIPFYLHKEDIITFKSVENYAHLYGFGAYVPFDGEILELKGGTTVDFGEIKLNVLFTPGHAPGHVVFYNEANNWVINGDVLFNGSFGRVDLPGGNIDILKKSIHEIMFKLPEETVVYCGHGPTTTIGKEKKSNYILQF